MPNQRACLPCKNKGVYDYLNERLSRGASVTTVSVELAQPHRMESLGFKRPPGPSMLESHVRKHGRRLTPVDPTNMPVFSGEPEPREMAVFDPSKDIASAIQRQALEQLAAGDMRISAAHALRAQELLDRRAEKVADREMQVALARIVLSKRLPPEALVGGDDVIDGTYQEVSNEEGATAS